MRSLPRRCGLLLAAGGALALGACGTVDPGPDTGPPAGCNAPAAFFASDVWPRYFQQYSCGQSDCHDASSGHGYFRLHDVSLVPAPAPSDPVAAWPTEWIVNLRSVQHNVSCKSPLESLVLAVPEGRSMPHPPGTTVTDPAAADALFTMWLP